MADWLNMVARIVAGLAGTALAASTFISAVKTVVLPRGGSQRLTRLVFVATRYLFEFQAHPKRTFAHRDRVLQLWAPLALVLLPFLWLSMVIVGFTAIQWSITGGLLRQAFLRSGSSMLTLGVSFDTSLPAAIASFVQAAIGIVLSALLISYLPSIYSAYQRREALVGLLESRAGMPPSPYEMLRRYHWIGAMDILDQDLFEKWEQWFVEVEESHTSFAALVFFRSPRPERSWITAAGCVLDTASIRLSCFDEPYRGRTSLCLRAGFLSLHRIATYFGIPFDPTPAPTDPISVTRAEFDLMCEELTEAGLALRTDRDQMWADFQGWRVNYDAVLVGLSKLIVAPEAKWSSDREGERWVPRVGFSKQGSRIHRGGRIR
jgi:hypothetical protein